MSALLYPQPIGTTCWSYEGDPCLFLDYKRVGGTDIKQLMTPNSENDNPFPSDLKSIEWRKQACKQRAKVRLTDTWNRNELYNGVKQGTNSN